MHDRTLGATAAAAAAMLFGTAFVATGFQLHGFTPLGAALWRASLATVALVVLSLAIRAGGGDRDASVPSSGPPPPIAGRLGRLLVIGFLGGFVFLSGMNLAVSYVGATITSFVAGLYAITAALFAPVVLGERLAWRALAGFAVALVGTALLAELGPSSSAAAGLAAGGVAALSYGLALVLIRRWSKLIQVGPVGIALANAFVSATGLAVVVIVLDPGLAVPKASTPEVVVSTIWLVGVMAVGPLLTTVALRRVEAALASSMLLLNPITATVLAAILLSERPSPPQLIGGVLVLAGMAAATDLLGAIRRRAARSVEPGRAVG